MAKFNNYGAMMIKSIEQLKQEQAAALVKLEREHAINALLPSEPSMIVIHSGTTFPWVCYKVKTMVEVEQLFLQFPVILPLVYAKNGCAITAHIEEYPKYSEHIEGEYCLKIEVSQGSGWGVKVNFCFYTVIQGEKLRIGIELMENTYKFSASLQEVSNWNRKNTYNKSANNILNSYSDKTVGFWSGEVTEPTANYVYLFVADDYECTVFNHCLEQLKTIAGVLHA
jgi:hypothetical protein